MRIHKILYITLLLLAAVTTLDAKQPGRTIAISDVRTEITGDDLEIFFHVSVTGLDFGCDGQAKLEFAIESADRRLVLPVVIYSGTTRYRYERRREELSGTYIVEPYKIYKGVKKNKTYELDYALTVPYYTWMEHASATYAEYAHDCSGVYMVSDGVLVADLNPAPVYVEPEVWAPDSTLYPNLVSFLVPEVEEVKNRASMLSLSIGFPVNVTEVRPAFGNNSYELARADSLVSVLQSNDLININSVNIRGYASPEGRYSVNERLARGRSESFKQYLIRNYPDNPYIRNAHTSWEPEDWEGFGRLIADCDIPGKQDVLAIVNDNTIAPDDKDRMLQHIVWWSDNYKVILSEMYPKLRRIELKVDYTVQNLSDAQARELLYTNPDMLSLNEIYRVANYYEPGSKQYRDVYEIAARQYPNDVIANNNAAAALLREGNSEQALPYLQKIGENKDSYINHGAYHYISGNLDKALEYFNKAKAEGVEQADHNIELVTPVNYK